MKDTRKTIIDCTKAKIPALCASILFILILINYIDRSIIGFTSGYISQQFHANNTSIGLLISSFFFGAMLSNLVCGTLADRYNNKYIWALAGVIWSTALIGQSMVHSETNFVIMRSLAGFGEGFVFPLLNRFLKNNNYKNETIITGVLTFGIPLSNAISGILLPNIIQLAGWHQTYLIMGLLSALVTTLLYFTCNKQISSHTILEPKKDSIFKSLKNSVLNKNLLKSYLSTFCYGLILLFYISWLPDMLMQKFHINIKQSGILSALPWAISCITILVGSFYLEKRSDNNRSVHASFLKPISISLFISSMCFVITSQLNNILALILVITINLSTIMFTNSALFLTVRRSVANEVGMATGLMAVCFLAACISIGPITGLILDITGSYNDVFLVMSAILLIVTLIVGCRSKEEICSATQK